MPYLINGQPLSDDRVRSEEMRIRHDPHFTSIGDDAERIKRVRETAQLAAIDKLLVEQIAVTDTRPIDPIDLENEIARQRANCNPRGPLSLDHLRTVLEGKLRLQRTEREMTSGACKPSPEEVEVFYRQNRERFRAPAMFEAAHIVKHVNDGQNEQQALVCIQRALAELESGARFADVAERTSDCKGRGSDLGWFSAGSMVPEFEDAIRDLAPGQRTGIFRTKFGFHIAELRSKTPAGPVEFEEVRDDICRVLTKISEHKEYLRVIAEIRSRADIRWIPEGEQSKEQEGNARAAQSA